MGILSLAGAGRGHLTTGPILAGCPARTGQGARPHAAHPRGRTGPASWSWWGCRPVYSNSVITASAPAVAAGPGGPLTALSWAVGVFVG